jgi:hypothetical protein
MGFAMGASAIYSSFARKWLGHDGVCPEGARGSVKAQLKVELAKLSP